MCYTYLVHHDTEESKHYRRSYFCGPCETQIIVLILGVICFILAFLELMLLGGIDLLWFFLIITGFSSILGYIYEHPAGLILPFLFELEMSVHALCYAAAAFVTRFSHYPMPAVNKAVHHMVKVFQERYHLSVPDETLMLWIMGVTLFVAIGHFYFTYLVADAFRTMYHNRANRVSRPKNLPAPDYRIMIC